MTAAQKGSNEGSVPTHVATDELSEFVGNIAKSLGASAATVALAVNIFRDHDIEVCHRYDDLAFLLLSKHLTGACCIGIHHGGGYHVAR